MSNSPQTNIKENKCVTVSNG